MATAAEFLTRLDRALKAAGHAIDGLSPRPDGTVQVFPPSLQAACQPIIDRFNPDDPVHVQAEKDAEIDNMRGLRALARATFELKTTNWTLVQYLDRIKQIYRSL